MAGEHGDENGVSKEWHRWRGAVDEQIAGVREDVLVLRGWKQDHERECESKRAVMHERINVTNSDVASLRTSVAELKGRWAVIAAVCAAVGSMVGGGIVALLVNYLSAR